MLIQLSVALCAFYSCIPQISLTRDITGIISYKMIIVGKSMDHKTQSILNKVRRRCLEGGRGGGGNFFINIMRNCSSTGQGTHRSYCSVGRNHPG